MIELLTYDAFNEKDKDHPAVGYTKYFQQIYMQRLCAGYKSSQDACEIGPHENFSIIEGFNNNRHVIDPYLHGGGYGIDHVPSTMPYPFVIYRCLLGEDSDIIPSNLFDFSFSVSVLEHIGQKAVDYDCRPVETPPDAQENPRNSFCQELYRTTKPGGITIHSVDHAPRNITFIKNFQDAGFHLISNDTIPSLDLMLNSENAVRQRHSWIDASVPMSREEMKLHSVFICGFIKPP